MKGCPSLEFVVDCAAIVSNLFLLIETLHSIALQCKIEYPSPLQAVTCILSDSIVYFITELDVKTLIIASIAQQMLKEGFGLLCKLSPNMFLNNSIRIEICNS